MRRAFVILALLAGCGPALPSTSFVDKLRVLAVQAEPPEIAPGQTTQLTLLAVEPFIEGADVHPPATPSPVTALWLACPEAPATTSTSFIPCGTSITQTTTLPPNCSDQPDADLCLAGTGSQVSFTAPMDALRKGSDGSATILLTVAVADTPEGAIGCLTSAAATGVPTNPDHCILALKELTVSDPATHTARNHNPQLTSLRFELAASGDDGGVISPDGGATEESPVDLVAGNGTLPVRTSHSPGFQLATTRAADAAEIESDGTYEVLTLSWYTTAGSFGDSRSVFIPPGCGDPTLCPEQSPAPTTTTGYDPPTQAERGEWVDASNTVDFWAVVRDDRGGVGWLKGSAQVQ